MVLSTDLLKNAKSVMENLKHNIYVALGVCVAIGLSAAYGIFYLIVGFTV